MIVTPLASSLLVVTQADHARFAADLLALFRSPTVARHPRRALLLRAVAEHDNGWWESDAAPRIAATGAPLDFRAIPDEARREIWRRGVARHAAAEPEVAALVAAHALRLLRSRRGADDSWSHLLDELETLRDELSLQAGLQPEEVEELDSWMELADGLALAAATGDDRFVSRQDLYAAARAGDEENVLELAPFPLAGATRIALSCRRLGRPTFSSAAELGAALAAARWERRPVRLLPRDERGAGSQAPCGSVA